MLFEGRKFDEKNFFSNDPRMCSEAVGVALSVAKHLGTVLTSLDITWDNLKKSEKMKFFASKFSKSMFDVCFKMTKITFFKVAVERTLKNVFFVILKHTSNIMTMKMSPKVEEPIGRSFSFLKVCQKLVNS